VSQEGDEESSDDGEGDAEAPKKQFTHKAPGPRPNRRKTAQQKKTTYKSKEFISSDDSDTDK
jgi:hypothetical protein